MGKFPIIGKANVVKTLPSRKPSILLRVAFRTMDETTNPHGLGGFLAALENPLLLISRGLGKNMDMHGLLRIKEWPGFPRVNPGKSRGNGCAFPIENLNDPGGSRKSLFLHGRFQNVDEREKLWWVTRRKCEFLALCDVCPVSKEPGPGTFPPLKCRMEWDENLGWFYHRTLKPKVDMILWGIVDRLTKGSSIYSVKTTWREQTSGASPLGCSLWDSQENVHGGKIHLSLLGKSSEIFRLNFPNLPLGTGGRRLNQIPEDTPHFPRLGGLG